MAKKNDPYVYPNTEILKNLHNIKDPLILNQMEAEYTSLRIKEITEVPLEGKYDLEHFFEFHKYIFQDIYEWAGIPRSINIEKLEPSLGGLSVEYEKADRITDAIHTILDRMTSLSWSQMSLDQKASQFSENMAALWKIHSFREGNTRTTVTFCCQFIESKGIPIDRKLFEENSSYVRTSLVAASANFTDLGDLSKPEYLVRIVKDSMLQGLARQISQEESIKATRGKEIKNISNGDCDRER